MVKLISMRQCIVFFFILPFIAGCKPNTINPPINIPSQTVVTLSPMNLPSQMEATVSPTVTSTPEFEGWQLPIPTLSNVNEIKMAELLKIDDCRLPCYLGITPGISTGSDTKKLFDSLAAGNFGHSRLEGNITLFGYAMWFNHKTKNSLPQPSDSEADMGITHDFGFAVDEDDTVQQIFVNIVSHDAGPKLQEYWSNYSPRNVFLQIGVPDGIYIGIGSGLALVYEKIGVVLIYDSYWNENLYCPQDEGRVFRRHFMLTNTEFPLDIYPSFENVSKNRSIWFPIDDALQMSIEQFYKKMIDKSSTCYKFKN